MMEVISEIDTCKRLWEQYNKKGSLWDDWDIIMSLYDKSRHQFHFITDSLNLVPLWYDTKDNVYHYAGGTLPENRKIFSTPQFFNSAMESIRARILINDICEDDARQLMEKGIAFETDHRYVLDLTRCERSFDSYVKNFNKKHRKNLRNDLKKVEMYEVCWEKLSHVDRFIELSTHRFGHESDFVHEHNKREIERFLLALEKKKCLYTSIVTHDKKVIGIEYGAIYNKVYYVINGAYDQNVQNLGKLLIVAHIKKAIELGADMVDFMVGDTGWKTLWKFDRIPVYTYRKE